MRHSPSQGFLQVKYIHASALLQGTCLLDPRHALARGVHPPHGFWLPGFLPGPIFRFITRRSQSRRGGRRPSRPGQIGQRPKAIADDLASLVNQTYEKFRRQEGGEKRFLIVSADRWRWRVAAVDAGIDLAYASG